MSFLKEHRFSETFLRRLERLALVYRRTANSQMQGERRSKRRGQSVEFADFRPYALGDDFRRIDWNAFARLERLFIKLFLEEQEIILHLLIDNSASMDWGEPKKLDYAIQAAAAVGYIALVGLDRVSATALIPAGNRSGGYFAPVRGRSSALRLFSFLDSIQPVASQRSPTSTLGVLGSGNGKPGSVLLLSDLLGDTWQVTVNLLRSQGHEVSIIHILAPDEMEPVLNGDFRLVDSETAQQVEITADFETIQRYKDYLRVWQDSWENFCLRRGIGYIPVTTSLDLEELLFAFLPRQGILR